MQAWHERYFVLIDLGEDRATLEMYEEEGHVGQQAAVMSVALDDSVHIAIMAQSRRFANVILLICSGRRPIVLAADDDLTARSWLMTLELATQYDYNDGAGLNLPYPVVAPNPHYHRQNLADDAASNTAGSGSSAGSTCSCAPAFVRESSSAESAQRAASPPRAAYLEEPYFHGQ